jgi:hypothetical protein
MAMDSPTRTTATAIGAIGGIADLARTTRDIMAGAGAAVTADVAVDGATDAVMDGAAAVVTDEEMDGAAVVAMDETGVAVTASHPDRVVRAGASGAVREAAATDLEMVRGAASPGVAPALDQEATLVAAHVADR